MASCCNARCSRVVVVSGSRKTANASSSVGAPFSKCLMGNPYENAAIWKQFYDFAIELVDKVLIALRTTKMRASGLKIKSWKLRRLPALVSRERIVDERIQIAHPRLPTSSNSRGAVRYSRGFNVRASQIALGLDIYPKNTYHVFSYVFSGNPYIRW